MQRRDVANWTSQLVVEEVASKQTQIDFNWNVWIGEINRQKTEYPLLHHKDLVRRDLKYNTMQTATMLKRRFAL